MVTALLQVHTAGLSKSMSCPSHLHIFDIQFYMPCLSLASLSYQAHPASCRVCSVLRHPISWVSYMSIKHKQGSLSSCTASPSDNFAVVILLLAHELQVVISSKLPHTQLRKSTVIYMQPRTTPSSYSWMSSPISAVEQFITLQLV